MPTPRVYADFNSIEYSSIDRSVASIDLTGYGTLASLSNQKLRLFEGMKVLLYEPNDIEVEGVAYFDRAQTDPAGRTGKWFARIHSNIRDSAHPATEHHDHLCFGCGRSLLPHLKAVGQQYAEFCPHCGTSVMAPLAPPENAN
jgi:hypothetical protein